MARTNTETGTLQRRLKSRILFGSVTILLLVSVMIAASYSWFYTAKEATVSDITIQTVQADNLLIKGPDGEWGKGLTMTFPENFRMMSVGGDGRTFFQPNLTVEDGQSDFTVSSYTKIDPAEYAENGIYQFDFELQVESSLPIYLGKESSVLPAERCPDSAYGDFSSGYICGAMRIALLQKVGDAYVLRCVWIPNSTVELTVSASGAAVDANGAVEDTYQFISDTDGVAVNVTTNGKTSGTAEQGGVTYAWGDLEAPLQIGNIVGGETSSFRLLAWIDGNDRECHNALLSGLVSVKLEFSVGAVNE